MQVKALKSFGRTKAGTVVKVAAHEGRALIAIGLAERVEAVQAAPTFTEREQTQKVNKPSRREYRRRDIAAAPQAAVVKVCSGPLAGATIYYGDGEEEIEADNFVTGVSVEGGA